jgi:hypothetical protein
MKAIISMSVFVLLSMVSFAQNEPREEITNVLRISVDGGEYGFRDEAFIHFAEGATTGYDIEIDAKKWFSLDPEATMIWTVTSDDVNLAINNLPLGDLHTIYNDVPLHFVCGYNGGEYALNFGKLESFDPGIEIWFDDTRTEEGWIQVTATDSVYNFTGVPDDPSGRFMIHIFDPLVVSVNDAEAHKDLMRIYAANNTVFVKNPAKEIIKQISVYDMGGRAIHRAAGSGQETMQFNVNVKPGMYMVHVLTAKTTHAAKVYIKKF